MDSKITIAVALVAVIIIGGAAAFILMDDNDEPYSGVVYDDVRLTVFGNANGDDVLDGNDKYVIQKIISGDKNKEDCPYADANKDGNIDEADIAIVEKLIAGEETDVYFNDHMGTTHKVGYPLKNVVAVNEDMTSWHTCFGAGDALAGTTTNAKNYPNSTKMLPEKTKVLPSGMRGFSAQTWQAFIDLNKSLLDKGESIEAVVADRVTGVGDYKDDLDNLNIPVIVIRCTDPTLTIDGTVLMGFLYGNDICQKSLKFVDRCDKEMAYLNSKIDKIPESEKVHFLAFCMTNALAQKESQYTLMGIAAGGIPETRDPGSSSPHIKDPELITTYDDVVDQYIEYKTLDLAVKTPGQLFGDGIPMLEKGKAYNTTAFINVSIPGVCKVLYTACVMYPDLIERSYVDNVLQDLFDEFMPQIHTLKADGKFDVTKDISTIVTWQDWQDSLKA